MKNLLVLTAGLLMTMEVMAFSVDGKASSTAFVVDENCSNLSTQFYNETEQKALDQAQKTAQSYCGNRKARLLEVINSDAFCTEGGVWQSITTLKVAITADYTCFRE